MHFTSLLAQMPSSGEQFYRPCLADKSDNAHSIIQKSSCLASHLLWEPCWYVLEEEKSGYLSCSDNSSLRWCQCESHDLYSSPAFGIFSYFELREGHGCSTLYALVWGVSMRYRVHKCHIRCGYSEAANLVCVKHMYTYCWIRCDNFSKNHSYW